MAQRWVTAGSLEKLKKERLSKRSIKALQTIISGIDHKRDADGNLDPFWQNVYENSVRELKEDAAKGKR